MAGATKIKRGRAFGVLLSALVVAAVFAAAALADNTLTDGDVTDTPLDPLAYGNVCVGQATTVGVHVFINRNGSPGSTNVFKDGSTATVSVLSAVGAGLSATVPSSPGDEIVLASDWGAQPNNTRSAAVLSSVTVNPTTLGPGSGTITYRSTGVNSSNATINRDGPLAVSWTAVDCTAPVITPTVTPASPTGSNGWYKSGSVTVTFSVADAESAISAKSVACDATNTVGTDGTHAFTCSATSSGGTSSSTVTIKRDATIPTASLNSLPASTTAATINVTGTATDATSGVDGVAVNGGAATFDGLTGAFSRAVSLSCGANSISAVSTDKAGNDSAAASASVTRICDTTPPAVTVTVPSAPSGQDGYFNAANGAQTVNVSASDPSNVSDLSCTVNGSPVTVGSQSGSNPRTGSFQLSADGTHNVACAATDGVGNSGAAAGSASTGVVKIDATAPTISFMSRTPAANGNGWNNGDVTVSWSCSDSLSGVVAASVSQLLSTEGSSLSATGTCADKAGNSASDTQSGIKIDRTAPSIAFDSQTPAANGNGWNNGDVTVKWSCSDALSGPAAAFVTDTRTAEGVANATGTCTDLAGNSAGASREVKIDKTAPAVTCVSPAPVFMLGQAGAGVSATVADALSGAAQTPISGAADTSNPAGGNVSLTGSDKAGNSTAVLCAYHIASVGFAKPVEAPQVMNVAKLGRVVPVKATVVYDGGAVGPGGLPVYVQGLSQVNCATAEALDAVDQYAAAGSSNLGNQFRWDSAGSFWIYNFDTSAFAMKVGNCYRVNVFYGGSVDGSGKASGGSLAGYFLMQTTK